METRTRRRPVEMIERRAATSAECEQRVRTALTKLIKTGAPFTVENVCALAGVGKTFIYDKRRRQLTEAVLAARDASQASAIVAADQRLEQASASWRERALDAEALAKSLRAEVKRREARVNDLTGQLYDPEGNHLAEENARLRDVVNSQSINLHQAQNEIAMLRRSLDAARANVKRERERNVTQLFAPNGRMS
ncbi:MAG: hypothetical protein KAH46_32530 [Mycobacterium sp.]|uniref:hypothetical protein n=1 Tax=Mycobacterium sp. G7A2 TaxID=3317307 RepID=UPI00093D96D9|nr:hypothetical protein [Mycobacterium sp.]OKH71330.1 hypothetical protein EB73_10655 [Mycobacterium sp. SWH-M3]